MISPHWGQKVLLASCPGTLPILTNSSPTSMAIALACSRVRIGVGGSLVSLKAGVKRVKCRGTSVPRLSLIQIHISLILSISSFRVGITRLTISNQTPDSLMIFRVLSTGSMSAKATSRKNPAVKPLRSTQTASRCGKSAFRGSGFIAALV
ncbi:MAG: hypothetical protein DDT32_01535 [Syntrophomonadaceae bacterium]|nr:hypothetical protein [Bacillota bacterium]MBT9147770.1 hypothetical protein [Bacillota bacterium]